MSSVVSIVQCMNAVNEIYKKEKKILFTFSRLRSAVCGLRSVVVSAVNSVRVVSGEQQQQWMVEVEIANSEERT